MRQALELNQNDQDLRWNLGNLTKKDLNQILRLIGEKCYGAKNAIAEHDNDINGIPKAFFVEQVFHQLSTIRDYNHHWEFPTTIQV